jgi:proteinaceous RNase P
MAEARRKRPFEAEPLDGSEDDEEATRKKRFHFEVNRIRRELNNAGKENDVKKALELFDLAVENDYPLNQKSCQVILHLLSGGENWLEKLGTASENCGLNGDNESNSDNGNKSHVLSICNRDKDIYDYMKTRRIELNEFIYTGLARIAAICGNYSRAYSIAQDCKAFNTGKSKPRLRTYTPALLGFCSSGNVKQAMEVENEMRRLDLQLTEHEYRAMLEAVVKTGDKVYGNYILECMLREITTVEELTAKVLETYFNSFQENDSKGEGENGGGDACTYTVSRSKVDAGGMCSSSNEKLEKLDLKKGEIKTLAEKISNLALKRESRSDAFQTFQKWCERHGPYDLIIDGANVGFFGQAKGGMFVFGQVELMLEKVKELWPNRKPLVVLHNRRLHHFTKDSKANAALVDKLKNNHEIFASPSGSNDDWYWIYAAVLSGENGLLVTNDEMRDHIFQTLASRYFQKWKLCHQVHFSVYGKEVTLMEPGNYTKCIQRSGRGSWHFPIKDSQEWLCAKCNTAN